VRPLLDSNQRHAD